MSEEHEAKGRGIRGADDGDHDDNGSNDGDFSGAIFHS